jgi:hypothetical protein
MTPNYTVADNQNSFWWFGTGLTLDIGGAAGHAGVIWDLSGFVDGLGGVILAHVVAGAVGNGTGGNSTGMAGTYTLNLTPIPVPAAVWLFGGALCLLGVARRRSHATA